MPNKVVVKMTAVCTKAPNGDYGLNGYYPGGRYNVTHVVGNNYYRLIPRGGRSKPDACSAGVFEEYFRKTMGRVKDDVEDCEKMVTV